MNSDGKYYKMGHSTYSYSIVKICLSVIVLIMPAIVQNSMLIDNSFF